MVEERLSDGVAPSDRQQWLAQQLGEAAAKLGLDLPEAEVIAGTRSAGAACLDNGAEVWIRVIFDDPALGYGQFWDRNVAANAIHGVPKTIVQRWVDWHDGGKHLRAEVMTRAPDPTLSGYILLDRPEAVTDTWLTQTTHALDTLARHPLDDGGIHFDTVNNLLAAYFGATVDFSPIAWTTAHSDLCWGNVTGPELFILDWELWGKAPAGYDAATLYCTSLHHPNVATRVRLALAHLLETHSGKVATLCAVARYLRFVSDGTLPPHIAPLLRAVGKDTLIALG